MMNETNDPTYYTVFCPLLIICALPWLISGFYAVRVLKIVFKEKPEVFTTWDIKERIRLLKELEKTSDNYSGAKKKAIKWLIITVTAFIAVLSGILFIAYLQCP